MRYGPTLLNRLKMHTAANIHAGLPERQRISSPGPSASLLMWSLWAFIPFSRSGSLPICRLAGFRVAETISLEFPFSRVFQAILENRFGNSFGKMALDAGALSISEPRLPVGPSFWGASRWPHNLKR